MIRQNTRPHQSCYGLEREWIKKWLGLVPWSGLSGSSRAGNTSKIEWEEVWPAEGVSRDKAMRGTLLPRKTSVQWRKKKAAADLCSKDSQRHSTYSNNWNIHFWNIKSAKYLLFPFTWVTYSINNKKRAFKKNKKQQTQLLQLWKHLNILSEVLSVSFTSWQWYFKRQN